jgi:hypothetical protein
LIPYIIRNSRFEPMGGSPVNMDIREKYIGWRNLAIRDLLIVLGVSLTESVIGFFQSIMPIVKRVPSSSRFSALDDLGPSDGVGYK